MGDMIDVKFNMICPVQRISNGQSQYTYIADGVFVVDKIENYQKMDNDLGTVLVLRNENIQPENHKVGWVISLHDGNVYNIPNWIAPYSMGKVIKVVKV